MKGSFTRINHVPPKEGEAFAENVKEEIQEDIRNRSDWRRYKKYAHRQYRHHTAGNMVWGLLVIFAGAMFLLNALGIIPWEIWHIIALYWPVLLILIGLHIILGERNGADIIIFIIAFFLLLTILTRALIDINSPLVQLWYLDHLPWIGFLRSTPL